MLPCETWLVRWGTEASEIYERIYYRLAHDYLSFVVAMVSVTLHTGERGLLQQGRVRVTLCRLMWKCKPCMLSGCGGRYNRIVPLNPTGITGVM